MRRLLTLALAGSLVVAASAAAPSAAAAPTTSKSGKTTITLMTHDSFNASKRVLKQFTNDTGVSVKILRAGDAGAAVNQAILTKGDPLGDVFFGVDNTLLSRALDEGIFTRYESPELANVPEGLQLDSKHRVTPIDTGDVCVNYDRKYFADNGLPVPQTLEDLAKPEYRGLLVVENPATSSPGLAFLLATVARFDDGGWRAYWNQLRGNDVKVVDGWEQAYSTEFSGSAGKGNYPLVVSYASSPPAEVVNAEGAEPTEAPTGVMLDTCFRQIEFAGVLKGTEHAKEAKQFVDFLLSKRFQEDMPLQMFVFPVREDAELPAEFTKFTEVPPKPLVLPVRDIARNRDTWINEWTDTVLR
jgi:thiamine transport system substrate-binding protein